MINEMKIVKLKIADIKFDVANPNKMNDEQLQALRFSLKKFGQLKPPVVDQTFTICDGEHQVRAYMAEGVEEITCIQVETTPEGRRLIRQTMNKLHGTHGPKLDLEEYKAILENGLMNDLSSLLAQRREELEQFIKDQEALSNSLLDKEEDFDADSAVSNPKYKIEKGDVYQLGEHRLMCGDSTSASDVSVLMGGGLG